MNVLKGRKCNELLGNQACKVMPRLGATICLAVFLFLVPFSNRVQAQQTIFLQVAGIPGDSTSLSHPNWIECSSFSQEVSGSSNRLPCGGTGQLTGTPGDFLVLKSLDRATPKLSLAAATGEHISRVTLEVEKESGGEQITYRVVMTDVVVSKTSGGLAPNSGSVPTEEIAFSFSTIKWVFFVYDDRGALKGTVAASWDVCTQKPALATPEPATP